MYRLGTPYRYTKDMSGPRAAGLVRRAAIYSVRLRVPAWAERATGVREIRRSLGTADPILARRLSMLAKLWLDEAMAELKQQP